jgi:hypothetical protein
MTPTTKKLIDRAAAQIVRDVGRMRLSEVSNLPAVDRSGLPISIKVTIGAKGYVRYVEVRLGHYEGYEEHSNDRILGLVLGGLPGSAFALVRQQVEMAVRDARKAHRWCAA